MKASTIDSHVSRVTGQKRKMLEVEWSNLDRVLKKGEWYELTDEIVPCKVWNNGEEDWFIAMVKPFLETYPNGKTYFCAVTLDEFPDEWDNATPLTEKDLFKG